MIKRKKIRQTWFGFAPKSLKRRAAEKLLQKPRLRIKKYRARPGQLMLQFETAEILAKYKKQRESILGQLAGLEAKIHEQTARVLNSGPERIWKGIKEMNERKRALNAELRRIDSLLKRNF